MAFLTPFADLVHLNTDRIADAYHASKDVEGFANVASLADIRANDGNLSIPLYVRGKAVSDEKGVFSAADDLKAAIRDWDENTEYLNIQITRMLVSFFLHKE